MGVDLVRVERVAYLHARYGARFVVRLFTPAEAASCGGVASSLAAHLAAKEAVSKALGTGLGRVRWADLEVLPVEDGWRVSLHGAAADLAAELGLGRWALYLGHDARFVLAVALAWREGASAG